MIQFTINKSIKKQIMLEKWRKNDEKRRVLNFYSYFYIENMQILQKQYNNVSTLHPVIVQGSTISTFIEMMMIKGML